MLAAEQFCQLEARHTAHHYVKQQQGVLRREHLQGCLRRFSGIYLVARLLQIELQDFAQVGFVVHYKYSRFVHRKVFCKGGAATPFVDAAILRIVSGRNWTGVVNIV